ncbi:MAG: hypothetical protein ACJAZM_002558 [Cyclobacteriaceae bacterium]|jgi:alpha-1,6-mannosyltransferase
MQSRSSGTRSSESFYTFAFIFLAAISALQLYIERHQSFTLLFVFGIAFIALLWLAFEQQISFREILIIGLSARAITFFGLPTLSDDLYRFIWDGFLLQEGLSPYALIPSDVVNVVMPEGLLSQLNSPHYYSVYPPLHQVLFYVSVALQDSLLGQANVMRSIIVLMETIGAYQLYLLLPKERKHLISLYFLNPLLIIESTGNLHVEGLVTVVILFMIAALSKKHLLLTAVSFALAVGLKLLPLIWLPLLAWHHRWHDGIKFTTLAVCITSIILLPLFFDTNYIGLLESLQLYQQKFEFNASIYYVLRVGGFWIKGYNIIESLGPTLAILTACSIIVFSVATGLRQNMKPTEGLMWVWFMYLLFANTVHPWYILPLIPLGLLAGYYFPVIWSFLVLLSYVGYTEVGYEPHFVWIITEYLLLFAFISYEITQKVKNRRHHSQHIRADQ